MERKCKPWSTCPFWSNLNLFTRFALAFRLIQKYYNNWATTCDFHQCGILTSVDSDEPVQPPFKLRNSKSCSVSSLTVIEYSSGLQRLWSDWAYAQAHLRLCWSHIPHCWKSHALLYKRRYVKFLFVCFDSLLPSQQFFSYVGTGLPGLNQY